MLILLIHSGAKPMDPRIMQDDVREVISGIHQRMQTVGSS